MADLKDVKTSHATVRVGKNGVTDDLIQEIRRRLKSHKFVKVSIPRVEDRQGYAENLAELVGAELVEVRGFTLILKKEG